MDEPRMPQQGEETSTSSLRSGRRGTIINDIVVSKIAGIAVQEIEGIQMGGGTALAVGGFWHLLRRLEVADPDLPAPRSVLVGATQPPRGLLRGVLDGPPCLPGGDLSAHRGRCLLPGLSCARASSPGGGGTLGFGTSASGKSPGTRARRSGWLYAGKRLLSCAGRLAYLRSRTRQRPVTPSRRNVAVAERRGSGRTRPSSRVREKDAFASPSE